jgi:hypothetical protein
LEFFYIWWLNKNNENNATQKSELNAAMAFSQSLAPIMCRHKKNALYKDNKTIEQ